MLAATATATSVGGISAIVLESLYHYYYKKDEGGCLSSAVLAALLLDQKKSEPKSQASCMPEVADELSDESLLLQVKGKAIADLIAGLEVGSLSESLHAVSEAKVRAKIQSQLASSLNSGSLAAALDAPSWKYKIQQKVQGNLSKAVHLNSRPSSDPVVIPILPLEGLRKQSVSKPSYVHLPPYVTCTASGTWGSGESNDTCSASMVSTESNVESATTSARDASSSNLPSPWSSGSECMNRHHISYTISGKACAKKMLKAQGPRRSKSFSTQKLFSERVLKSIDVNQNVAGTKANIRKEQRKEEEREEGNEERVTYATPRGVTPPTTARHNYPTSARPTPPSARPTPPRQGVWRLDENKKWVRSAPSHGAEFFCIESPHPEFFRIDYSDSDNDSDAENSEMIVFGSPAMKPTPRCDFIQLR